MNAMEQTINSYLSTRGATLWGRAFDIHNAEGKEIATQFIQDLWIELEDIESDLHYQATEKADG